MTEQNPNSAVELAAAAVRSKKDDVRAAEIRLIELLDERARVDRELQEASINAARQKARAARNGESIASPADLDASQLRERRLELPYEVHAQEIFVFESKIALYDAEDADRRARHEAAEAVYVEVKGRFEAVEAEFKSARANRVDATRSFHQSTLRKVATDAISDLEANPPGISASAETYSRRSARSRMTVR